MNSFTKRRTTDAQAQTKGTTFSGHPARIERQRRPGVNDQERTTGPVETWIAPLRHMAIHGNTMKQEIVWTKNNLQSIVSICQYI